jgi:hypothetical protein
MILPNEIKQNDILKVLVNEEGTEEELYGVVAMNTGLTLGMHFLEPTELFYKSACVWKLSDDEMTPVPYESVMEHYPTGTTFADLELKPLGTNMFVYYCEIDIEDPDSDVYDEDGSSNSSLDGFIVSDTELEGGMPINHEEIDRDWNQWEPTTSGGKSFKEAIDKIEERVRNLGK